MKVTQIAFVGIPVTEMKRAREFYEGVLGLHPDPEMTGEMWTEYPIGAGTLAIACIGDEWKPSDQGTSAAIGRLSCPSSASSCFERFSLPCGEVVARRVSEGTLHTDQWQNDIKLSNPWLTRRAMIWSSPLSSAPLFGTGFHRQTLQFTLAARSGSSSLAEPEFRP